jgi:Family of unknown function (DUF5681)
MTIGEPFEPVASVVATDEQKEPTTAEDRVGYGRPPKATRFAPGRSGNPKGRPRGTRTVGTILRDVIRQQVAVTESGKTRRVPVIEGMLRRLVNDALRGDAGAVKLLLSLVDRYGDSPEAVVKLADMLAEDQQILARYLQRPDAREPCASETSGLPAVNSNPEQRGDDDDGSV